MKNTLKKGLLMALITTGTFMGSAVTNQAKALGWVCVGTTLYQSHGWWIFQFPIYDGFYIENSVSCEGY